MTTTSGEVQLNGLAVDCGFSADGNVELNSASVDCGFSAGADIDLPLPEIDSYFETCGEVFLPRLRVWTPETFGAGIVANITLNKITANVGVFASAVRLSPITVTSQTGMLSGNNVLSSILVSATAQDLQRYRSEIALNPLAVEALTGSIATGELGNVAVSATAHVPANFHADLIELGKMIVSSRVSTRKRTTANMKLGNIAVSSLFSGWDVSARMRLRRMKVRSFVETENDLLADILLSAMGCSSRAWAEDAEGITAEVAIPGIAVLAKTVSTLADWYYLQYELQRSVSGVRLQEADSGDYHYFENDRDS